MTGKNAPRDRKVLHIYHTKELHQILPFRILGYHTHETPRHDEPKIIPL